LGGWNEKDCFKNYYDRAFPVDALLGAAAFNARRPEQYCLPRSSIGMAFYPVYALATTEINNTNRTTNRPAQAALSLD
jgi:hypothetical protein